MNFKEIINSNKHNIRHIIRKITNEDNEDLEQEVFVKIWKNSEKYKEQGCFKSWVTTIAKNISKDYMKSAKKKHEQLTSGEDDKTLENITDKKSTPELKVLHNDRQERILNAINELKPKFKEVIMFCEIYGYTYEDCAKRLNCPIGTVKSRLYNAKKLLAVKLKDLL